MTRTDAHAVARPPVYIPIEEHERLFNLADAASDREPGAELLLEELARAQVGSLDDAPADAVRMNDHVTFTFDGTQYRALRLVYPSEADIRVQRISVLTQVGAMLLGVRAGQSISWSGPDGRKHVLEVEKVARG